MPGFIFVIPAKAGTPLFWRSAWCKLGRGLRRGDVVVAGIRPSVYSPNIDTILPRQIFCPVFAQSLKKLAIPLSVSGCDTSAFNTAGGAVA